ncbi:MAG: TonB-dependent receptor, partial [Flavisolibacter sp.]|nr:TonB-dependent receptor [Flavisolibacter sp.]
IISGAGYRYQILKWLYLQGRANMDFNNGFTEFNNPTGGLGAGGFGLIYYDNTKKKYNGNYNVSEGVGRQMNYDFLLGGNHRFGDFSIDASFGGNLYNVYNRNFNITSTAFTERDVYSIGNGSVFTQNYNFSRRRVNSLYGLAELGYKNLLYINVTGREDWFSVLNLANNHYFYPSVSGSFIFSELIKDNLTWLDYGKIRGGWADVGSANGIGAYYGTLNYNFNTNLYSVPGIDFTIGSISGNDSPNPFVKPFSVSEKNIGLELKMFRSRVNVDIEVYDKKTDKQIIPAQISAASGYNTTVINYGSLQNRGIEFMLDVTPVRTRNFTWNSSFNNAYNTTKVLSLSPGTTRFTVQDWYNGGASNEFMGKLVYEVGKPLNQIAAKTYQRDNKGQILLTSGGRLIATPNDTLFGSADPKFVGGWNNNFRFKKLTLLVHMDYKFGGKVLSGSALNNLRQGHSKASLVGRRPGENGVVFDGVYQAGSGPNAGQKNTTAVFGQAFYADYRSLQIADPFIFKSDFIKLRNITLSYDFSSLVSTNVKFIKGLVLSASCRNVAILKKYTPDIDPESFASSGDLRLGYEAVSLPTTRMWGANLNVKF